MVLFGLNLTISNIHPDSVTTVVCVPPLLYQSVLTARAYRYWSKKCHKISRWFDIFDWNLHIGSIRAENGPVKITVGN